MGFEPIRAIREATSKLGQTAARVLRKDSVVILPASIRRNWLGIWFVGISAVMLAELVRGGGGIGGDARLYIIATRRWLGGADPWATAIDGWWYAAPPPSLIAVAPFALIPIEFGQGLMVASALGAGVATIWLLRRPWWWLAFPPLVLAIVDGNPQAWLIPLVMSRQGWLAVIAKIYVAPVLLVLGRWRQLAAAALLLLVTVTFLPWRAFITDYPSIATHLHTQSAGFSAFDMPILAPAAVAALLLVGRRRAAWLSVPALWPSSQWYYMSLAMPGLTPLSAAIAALPVPGAIVLALVVVALEVKGSRKQGE